MGPRTNAQSGFTLIEILAVLLIIGILSAVLITQLGGAQESAERDATRQTLAKLEAIIEDYSREKGDYPRSSFTTEEGVGNDGTNVGNEALVVALYSKGWEAGGLDNQLRDILINSDGDRSSKKLTDFGTTELLEIPDAWENPIAYFHRTDYEVTNRSYVTYGEVGAEVTSTPRAYKNPTTGDYYRTRSFQLISAGPDGRFATEDDIANFDRD